MSRLLALVLLALLLAPGTAWAQRMDRRPAGPEFTVGVRGGFDLEGEDPIVGAAVLAPVPWLRGLAVQAVGDLTFLDALTERQASVDLLYGLGGLRIGGGVVFRNTVWPEALTDPSPIEDLPRETRTGFSAVVGLGGTPLGDSPFVLGLEIRFVWVDDFRPRPLTVGAGVAPGRLLR